MSENEEINDVLQIINETSYEEPEYIVEQAMARIYPVPLATIIVIFAIISIIINIKRKAKNRIILSIIFPIIAVIITKSLEKLAFKCAIDRYSYSIAIPAYLGVGILIAIVGTLIVMIFKRKK